MRLHPDLLELEDHSTGYGGAGSLSHVVFPNGSVASIPQRAGDLLVSVAKARLELR